MMLLSQLSQSLQNEVNKYILVLSILMSVTLVFLSFFPNGFVFW